MSNFPDQEAVQNYIHYGKPLPKPTFTLEQLQQAKVDFKSKLTQENAHKVETNPDQYYDPYRWKDLRRQLRLYTLALSYTGAWGVSVAIQSFTKKGVSPLHFIGSMAALSLVTAPIAQSIVGYSPQGDFMHYYAEVEKCIKEHKQQE